MFLLVQHKNCKALLIKMFLIKFTMNVNYFNVNILKYISNIVYYAMIEEKI